MSDTCNICTEKYNKSTRCKISCYCTFSACKNCWKNYIVVLNTDIKCMEPKCNIILTREFIVENFDRKFINNEYKEYKKNVLFNNQLSLFPETQREIDIEKEKNIIIKQIHDRTIRLQYIRVFMLELDFMRVSDFYRCPIIGHNHTLSKTLYCKNRSTSVLHIYMNNNKEFDKILENKPIIDSKTLHEICDIKYPKEFIDIDKKIFNIELINPIYRAHVIATIEDFLWSEKRRINEEISDLHYQKTTISQLIYRTQGPCINSSCEGRLSDKYQCRVCKIVVCSECKEIKLENHVCEKTSVESIELIKKETKPCPKCAVPIYRASGCQDMYCTNCKIYFNWHTLALCKGTPHNPERDDEIRAGPSSYVPRNENDIICGREIDFHFRKKLSEGLSSFLSRSKCMRISDISLSIKNVVLNNSTNDPYLFNQLRYEFLSDRIDKNVFKKSLEQRDRYVQMDARVREALLTFRSCAIELLYRIKSDPLQHKKIMEELEELYNIIRSQIDHIKNIYGLASSRESKRFDEMNLNY